MKLTELRKALDDFLAPDAEPPTAEDLEKLEKAWASLKPGTLPSYQPVIEDRLQYLKRPRWTDQSRP